MLSITTIANELNINIRTAYARLRVRGLLGRKVRRGSGRYVEIVRALVTPIAHKTLEAVA